MSKRPTDLAAGVVSRRDVLRLGAAGVTGLAWLGLAGCRGSGTAADDVLVLAHWGGSYQDAWDKAWVRPFAAERQLRAIYDGMDVVKLRSMVETNSVTWDLCCGITPDMGARDAAALFEPIDYDVLGDSAAGVPDRFKEPHRIGFEFYAEVLGFNTERLEAEPASWRDFLDTERFPGKRALPGYVSELALEMVLLGDGVPAASLYPLDLDRAFARLARIRDQVVFYENVTQAQQLLQDGEVVMAGAPANRVFSAIEEGAPLRIQWNQALTIAGYNAVPKGAPHKDTAMSLIKYLVDPARNALMSDHLPIAPLNARAVERIKPARAELLPTYGDRPRRSVEASKEYYVQHLEEASRRYSEWLSS